MNDYKRNLDNELGNGRIVSVVFARPSGNQNESAAVNQIQSEMTSVLVDSLLFFMLRISILCNVLQCPFIRHSLFLFQFITCSFILVAEFLKKLLSESVE